MGPGVRRKRAGAQRRQPAPFRTWLIEHNFAWAASSYLRNGHVPTLGASDTYALAQHVTTIVGESPSRVYLAGASMGGHITGLSIETYRGDYAGALPVCGVMADQKLFDYFSDASLGEPTPGVPAFPATNRSTYYALDDDPTVSPDESRLNDTIKRVDRFDSPTPDGVAEVGSISGDIDIPVLTMHTLGDAFAPFSLQQLYHDRVAAKGGSDPLVQRAVREMAMARSAEQEWDDAVSDLVDWVQLGEKPMGDDATTDAVMTADDDGCDFTLGERPFVPACPVRSDS